MVEGEGRRRIGLDIEKLPEFRNGLREFVEAVSECPQCSLKLALELVDSSDPEDKALLKEVLVGLGKALVKHEEYRAPSIIERFPIIAGWLRGEIGLRRWLKEVD
ncbi:MAG: hypothetical protein QXX41_12765 [Nitrososphaerota archaeon]